VSSRDGALDAPEKTVETPARAEVDTPVTEDRESTRVSVIKPAARWPHLDVPELWHYRELLFRLAWRDVAVRYKQTSIGIAWAILQPFLTMVVFTLVFGKFANFSSNGLPYQIFVYSALLPWTYFASSVALSSASVVSNRTMVTKVYFPRVLLPLAAVTVPVVDFVFASAVLVGMIFWFQAWPTWAVILAPGFLFLAFVTALGVGLFLSAVAVRYRDVPYTIPFILQLWMFVSGVFYAFNTLPEKWQWLLALNPMTAVIAGFRWGLIGAPAPELARTLISVAAAAVIFVIGLWYFRRSEPRFADTI
jgi:lipopolysaccharide transport system permease protein